MKISDLPQITVIQRNSPDGKDQMVYYSLNNRRLFLFKSLKKRGLLPGGKIPCRVRFVRPNEMDRYTVERCSLQAKFIFSVKGKGDDADDGGSSESSSEDESGVPKNETKNNEKAKQNKPKQDPEQDREPVAVKSGGKEENESDEDQEGGVKK